MTKGPVPFDDSFMISGRGLVVTVNRQVMRNELGDNFSIGINELITLRQRFAGDSFAETDVVYRVRGIETTTSLMYPPRPGDGIGLVLSKTSVPFPSTPPTQKDYTLMTESTLTKGTTESSSVSRFSIKRYGQRTSAPIEFEGFLNQTDAEIAAKALSTVTEGRWVVLENNTSTKTVAAFGIEERSDI